MAGALDWPTPMDFAPVQLPAKIPPGFPDFMTVKRQLILVGGKGGVGKTTLVTSLAGEWAKRGKRVLVVDLDPQGHATLWLREKNDGGRVVDALIARQSLARCILRSKHARLDVLPGGERLVALNLRLVVEMVVGLIRDPLLTHMAEHLRLPGVSPELIHSIQEQVGATLREAIRSEAADLDRAVDLRAALRTPAIADAYDVVLLDCGPTATNLLGDGHHETHRIEPATLAAGLDNEYSAEIGPALAVTTLGRVVLALGSIAHQAVLRALGITAARHPFGHGARHEIGAVTLFDSYHCSRLNTNTGRLTEQMFSDIFQMIREEF